MEEVLVVQSARKRFGATVALDGADLDLRRGEWLGLPGPNGAGKTTLVRSITGRVRLDDGTISLLGTSLNGAGAGGARRRQGVVPQELANYPLLTARVAGRRCEPVHRDTCDVDLAGGRELDSRLTGWAPPWTFRAPRPSAPGIPGSAIAPATRGVL